jgi:hypothetical protein
MSQGFDVLQPKSGRAYPVPCDEWDFLKSQLGRASGAPWIYQTIGSLLAGAAITTLVTIIIGALPSPAQSSAIIIAWAVVAVGAICAVLCFFFASQQGKMQSVQILDVVKQMEIIERRYESAGDGSISESKALKIILAKYGAQGKYVDLTEVLAAQVNKKGLEVFVSNELGGDPYKGVRKELVLEYEYNGSRRTVTVKEREFLKLP